MDLNRKVRVGFADQHRSLSRELLDVNKEIDELERQLALRLAARNELVDALDDLVDLIAGSKERPVPPVKKVKAR